MLKQFGISSVELLLSLAVISSASAYTLTLSEEVEKSIQTYQHETNVKDMLKKIKTSNTSKLSMPTQIDQDAGLDPSSVEAVLEPLEEAIELTEDTETTNHS